VFKCTENFFLLGALITLREFYYKVCTQGIPPYFWDREGIEFAYWEVLHGLCPQAQIVCANILSNIPRYLRLPVVLGYKF